MVSGSADVGYALEHKVGAVPDGLHSGDGPPSLWECCRPGPSSKLGPLYGTGLPAKSLPDGAQEVSRGEETVAGEAAGETNTGRSNFRGPTEGRRKSATARGETKRLDFRGDVEAHRQESLRTPRPTLRAGV